MPKQIAAPRINSARACCAIIILGLMFYVLPVRALAQEQAGDYEAQRERAFALVNESKFTEALPLLEKLAAAKPTDGEVVFMVGFTKLATSELIKDMATRKQARVSARNSIQKAKELGYEHPLVQQLLDAIPPDGSVEGKFSTNAQADELMRQGEAFFVQGELDKALAAYQRALQLDPQLYLAALFSGDMYNKKGEPERAGEWFARAIAINPDRELAYRYWGLGLVNQGKMQEARDKFIESFITEPYNSLARNGLIEWAQFNKVTLAHPNIEIPTNVSSSKPGEVNITLDEKTLGGNKDDGSSAWMMYGLARAAWVSDKKQGVSEKFAKAYPNEKTYRHSLAEEMDALRLVISVVNEQTKEKKIKQLNPSLFTLLKLNEAGLLESYILMARADEGISRDYNAYRKNNRDKLRRYMTEFVLGSGLE
ncbi:MAG: tetratricopeptide repeat protein [Pyrinomonadaceae bacterium]|nr:tetratricopeptide repeat protein [Pyrinomonadaceae bacterium]